MGLHALENYRIPKLRKDLTSRISRRFVESMWVATETNSILIPMHIELKHHLRFIMMGTDLNFSGHVQTEGVYMPVLLKIKLCLY